MQNREGSERRAVEEPEGKGEVVRGSWRARILNVAT